VNFENLSLIEPTEDLRSEFFSLLEEYQAIGEHYHLHDGAIQDFAAYLRKLQRLAQGDDLPRGIVQAITYWLVQDRQLLGESQLRPALTPMLEKIGGHIGYDIRPSMRRRGYGTAALALTLEKARARGLRRVLLTCDVQNAGSARIIEKNGGVRAGTFTYPLTGTTNLHYWIDLTDSGLPGQQPPPR
jgi:predicted acetyltransferase